MRVEHRLVISPVLLRLGLGEEPLIQPHLRIDRMRRAHPVDRPLHLAARRRAARFGIQIRRASQLHHGARRVLHHLVAPDDIRILQPHLAARLEPEILWRGHFHEVVLLDPQLA